MKGHWSQIIGTNAKCMVTKNDHIEYPRGAPQGHLLTYPGVLRDSTHPISAGGHGGTDSHACSGPITPHVFLDSASRILWLGRRPATMVDSTAPTAKKRSAVAQM